MCHEGVVIRRISSMAATASKSTSQIAEPLSNHILVIDAILVISDMLLINDISVINHISRLVEY